MANSAITTPASSSGNSTLIDPGIRKIFYQTYNQLAPKLGTVLKVESMDGAYEDEGSYAELGDVPEVDELDTYTEDAPFSTYNTTYTASKRGFLVPVSYELWEDQRTKVMGRTESLARSIARTTERQAASIFNNFFDTSYTSYGDDKPFGSTDHTRADGGTAQSNASATGITLTEANLETAMIAIREQLDDRGNLFDCVPGTIIVPPALEKEAIIITGSDKRSNTADNDANVYNMKEYTGGKLNIVVWNYLGAAGGGSDTAWFLQAPEHKATWKWRVKPQIQKLADSVGAKNDVMYWKARYRATFGWSEP